MDKKSATIPKMQQNKV